MQWCFCEHLCGAIDLIVLIGSFSEVPSGSLSDILALCVVGSRWIGLSKIFTRLGGGGGVPWQGVHRVAPSAHGCTGGSVSHQNVQMNVQKSLRVVGLSFFFFWTSVFLYSN